MYIIDASHEIDQKKLETFLQKHIETSLFLLSNVRLGGFDYKGQAHEAEYYTLQDEEGQIQSIISHNWEDILLIQMPCFSEEFVNQVYRKIKQKGRVIKGVFGELTQVSQFINMLEIEPSQFRLNSIQDLYALDLNHIIDPQHLKAIEDDLQLRQPDMGDMSFLLPWRKEYLQETLHAGLRAEELEEKAILDLKKQIKTKDYYLLDYKGKPVCFSGFNAVIFPYVQVGGVYTPSEHRGHGYAKYLLGETLKITSSKGFQKTILFTESPFAEKIYTSLGYQKIGQYDLLFFKNPV